MKIHVRTGSKKKCNPRVGDRKTVKGVDYVRTYRMCNGCYCVSNGRQLFDWVKADSERGIIAIETRELTDRLSKNEIECEK